MNALRSSFLVLATTALASPAAAPELRFAPDEGTELNKVFRTELELELDDLTASLGGIDLPPEALLQGYDLDDVGLRGSYEVAFTDTYESVEDGRPTSLLRRFESLEAEFESSQGEWSDENDDGEFEDTVRFVWDEDGEVYSCELIEGDEERDPPISVALAEDMDHRALLPEIEVEVGDDWLVLVSDLEALLIPPFDLERLLSAAVEVAEDDSEEDFATETVFAVLRQAEDLSEETLRCTWESVREDEDRELAVVSIVGDVELEFDLREFLETIGEREGGFLEQADIDDVTLTLELEFEGELLWDLAAGHFRELELTCDFDGSIDARLSGEMEGDTLEFLVVAEFSGALNRNARAGE